MPEMMNSEKGTSIEESNLSYISQLTWQDTQLNQASIDETRPIRLSVLPQNHETALRNSSLKYKFEMIQLNYLSHKIYISNQR